MPGFRGRGGGLDRPGVFRQGRFTKKPVFDRFSPGRRDARAGEARAFVSSARHLRNLTPHGLACQFNLRDETAAAMLDAEREKRGGDE